MIYLDTHIVVWLLTEKKESIPETSANLIRTEDLYISPIVILELQYLYEIERLKVSPDVIINQLKEQAQLNICNRSFYDVIHASLNEEWTRDPFDRLIVAQARLQDSFLLTKDTKILENYNKGAWD